MRHNPVTTIINIGGLAIGMAVTIVISIWIWRELSFNKNFPNYNSISQVMITGTFSGEMSTDPTCPIPLARALQNNFESDFRYVALASRPERHFLAGKDKKLNVTGMFAQDGLASMLSLLSVYGSVNTLDDPSSIIISISLSESLFGNNDPIGNIIKIDNKDNLKIAGVYRDFSETSSFSEIQYIGSWNYYKPQNDMLNNSWSNCAYLIYVQLQQATTNSAVSRKISGLLKDKITDIKPVVLLHPMEKWHLYETFKNGINTGGQIQYLWMFGLIGIFVLVLACINFINLSTARSANRAKEVGVLKTIGSGKTSLIFRFLGESVFTVAIAFAFSLVLVQAFLPWFNQLANTNMLTPFKSVNFYAISVLFILLTGIAAGCYPAFYLSSFRPVKVLKGVFKTGQYATSSRKILIVIQFFASIFLITATLIVLQQLNFTKNRPLGYSANGLINIAIITPEFRASYNAFRNELLQSGAVADVAASSSPVNQLMLSEGSYSWPGKSSSVNAVFGSVGVTESFGNTVQWHLKAGRDFSKDFPSDSAGVIINNTALHYMGLQDAVGKQLIYYQRPFTIIGVIDDAMMGSPFASVTPTTFFLSSRDLNNVTIKLSPSISTSRALQKVETIFKQYSQGIPFDYSFIDQQYAKQFRAVETTGVLAGVFAALAIFISSLGLYALASFMAEQRVKEIGIRKVLGASVSGIWSLLTREFVLLNGIAFLIALPVIWWCMNKWLDGYVYRTHISWQVFVFTAIITVIITLLTVSTQAIKAALANPVKSLRTE